MNTELSPSLAERIEIAQARTGLIYELVDQISERIFVSTSSMYHPRSEDATQGWVEVALDAIGKELTASSNETLKDEAFKLGLYDSHDEEATPALQKFLDAHGYKLMKCLNHPGVENCDWEDFVVPVPINHWLRDDGSGATFDQKWVDCPECGAIALPFDD
jgi:hypothetical protein